MATLRDPQDCHKLMIFRPKYFFDFKQSRTLTCDPQNRCAYQIQNGVKYHQNQVIFFSPFRWLTQTFYPRHTSLCFGVMRKMEYVTLN